MDPITRKLITAKGDLPVRVDDIFDSYCWTAAYGSGGAGIHTSTSSVDMTQGGMFWGKRRQQSSNWYIADTLLSPLDGSQGTPGYGESKWTGHSSSAPTDTAWMVPSDVTSICILCIGGGAGADAGNSGGGGGLTWINDVPVTPGTQLTVRQGKTGGRNGSGGGDTDGQDSYVKDTSGNIIIKAQGGKKGQNYSGGSGGDDINNIGAAYQSLTYGGNRGGHGDHHGGGSGGKGGGGGAGGYSGHGGDGGSTCNSGEDGEGGGGGGGGGHCHQDGGQGGGVGIYGEGDSGTGGTQGNYAGPGTGGSGGGTGAGTYGQWTEETGKFGGGSGAGSGGAGRGAVRILWGAGRAFPSTNVTYVESFSHAAYLSSSTGEKLQTAQESGIKKWTNNGFEWEGVVNNINESAANGDWDSFGYLFKKEPLFFTMVEYTGSANSQLIPHDLGCEPSMIWFKNLDSSAQNWCVYHKDIDATNPENYTLILDGGFDKEATSYVDNTMPTNTHFSIGAASGNGRTNSDGAKFVAYLFAGDHANFGNGIQVAATTGRYTGNGGSTHQISLGFEPQMVLIKSLTGGHNWQIFDKMRGIGEDRGDELLVPNLPATENGAPNYLDLNEDGFMLRSSQAMTNQNGTEYIYYAIRNNMQPKPKVATDVFAVVANGWGPNNQAGYGRFNFYSNFPVDFAFTKQPDSAGDWKVGTRASQDWIMNYNKGSTLETQNNDWRWDYQRGIGTNGATGWNAWMFRRARNFFDYKYWDGDDTTPRELSHELDAIPEMILVKCRLSLNEGWHVYHKDLTSQSYLTVYTTDGETSGNNLWTTSAPTASKFFVGDSNIVNSSSDSYYAQLFTSCPGVSSVGSYIATGNVQTIDCGFTAGVRFLLIKRVDAGSIGEWNVFDTARGIAEPHATLGEHFDDVPGQKTWTVPSGVTSVSYLAIGGGGGCVLYPSGTTGSSGGGGGALAYKNNVSVTPGSTITYFVGDGGKGATTQNNNDGRVISGHYANAGQPSWIDGTNQNDAVCMGYNGAGAQNYTGGDGGEFSNSTGDGGGDGGTGASNSGNSSWWGFGGGAAGYSGNGGDGACWRSGTLAGGSGGSGGGAGGGNSWAELHGTGMFGEGASGALGEAGSGGTNGGQYPTGGQYGGGGTSHGSNSGNDNMSGCTGAIRIVWSTDGTTREFPSTNVQQTDQGYDKILRLNSTAQQTTNANWLTAANEGFTVNSNTDLSITGAKYIYLAIA